MVWYRQFAGDALQLARQESDPELLRQMQTAVEEDKVVTILYLGRAM